MLIIAAVFCLFAFIYMTCEDLFGFQGYSKADRRMMREQDEETMIACGLDPNDFPEED